MEQLSSHWRDFYEILYWSIFQNLLCISILTLFGSGHQKTARNLPVPNVMYRTPDDGQRGCPKYLEFYNRKSLDN
jgi:hypothetical protein